MKNFLRPILEAVICLLFGAAVMFGVILCHSIRYMIQTGNEFALVLIKHGGQSFISLTGGMICMLCAIGGVIALFVYVILVVTTKGRH